MFEASINRQFKSRFAALNGVVHMGPISVLRRIFNGHSIDGYVLSNNFEDQLVVMKKKEFESLCKYIKVDIERTSRIPRAKLIKEKGMRGVELNPGSVLNPSNILPYRDVTCTGYSNYLNGAYLNQIQPYTHMILRGMNFSHYEVIYKAMQSNMAYAINKAYEKYGTNINGVLNKRSYNAEEYEVALLAVAYIGVEELNPDYLRVICANDGSGAKAMKGKLDKYKGKEKVEKQSNISEGKSNIVKEKTKMRYNFEDDEWLNIFFSRHIGKFEDYIGDNPCGLPEDTFNFVYKLKGKKYPLNFDYLSRVPNTYSEGFRLVPTEWPLKFIALSFNDLEKLSMDDVDIQIFQVMNELVEYIDKEESKLANENNLSDAEKKERDELYESWYLTYMNDRNLVYELKDTNGYNLNILFSSYTVSLSRNKTYHNKYTIKLKSDIPNTREELIICRYSTPLNKLEEELDKILNRYLSKVSLSLESQGVKDISPFNKLNRSELEAELERLEMELEGLKDEYNKIVEEDEKDIIDTINMLSERLPLKDSNAAWYIDELLDRPDEIAIQYINYDNYYPTVMFASTDEMTLSIDKFVSLMCIDVIQSDRFDDEGYLRVYPYDSEVGEDEIFIFSLSTYDKIGNLWESIYDCRRVARGLYESEALELYDWYRVVNAEKIIEDLKEDYLYEIHKRKEECKIELQRTKFEIDKLRKRLGKVSNDKSIFGNSDLNDFSEFEETSIENPPKKYVDIDPFESRSSYNPVLSGKLNELAKLADFSQF